MSNEDDLGFFFLIASGSYARCIVPVVFEACEMNTIYLNMPYNRAVCARVLLPT